MEELMATLNSGHSKAAQANLIEKNSDESIIKEAEARMAKLFQLIENVNDVLNVQLKNMDAD